MTTKTKYLLEKRRKIIGSDLYQQLVQSIKDLKTGKMQQTR